MAKPHVIVRLKDLSKFIPYERTQRDELIRKGFLKTVKLSPGGRAVGVTMASIVAYQKQCMGLDPLPDDGGDLDRSDIE